MRMSKDGEITDGGAFRASYGSGDNTLFQSLSRFHCSIVATAAKVVAIVNGERYKMRSLIRRNHYKRFC